MKKTINQSKIKSFTLSEVDGAYTLPSASVCIQELHCHDFYEFTIILAGNCAHSVDCKAPNQLTRGDFYFITPKNRHQIFNISSTHRHRDFYVTAEKFEKICKVLDFDAINELPLLAPVFKKKLSESQLVSLEEKSAYFNPTLFSFSSKTLDDLHTSIIVELLGFILQTKHEKKKSLPEWINTLIQRLDDREFVLNSVEEIVKTTSYAHGYVCREFKKHVGQTLLSYNNTVKLRLSVTLLETHTILQTASLLGWDNPKNYTIAFKKMFGITPSQYKKTLREQNS